MRNASLILLLFCGSLLSAQSIREFKSDTATYLDELNTFTGNALQGEERLDFDRFTRIFDSLPFRQRMEIIETSNRMLRHQCKPRPHFIAYQRVLLEFFEGDKTHHGYEEWQKGFWQFLESDNPVRRLMVQWLTLTQSMLADHMLYYSRVLAWKIDAPSFTFKEEGGLQVHVEDVTLTCYSGGDSIEILNASGTVDPLNLQWLGSRGTVTWDRVGMNKEDISASLGEYRIDLKKSSYTADTVVLKYPSLISQVLPGRLEDKVSKLKDVNKVRYPRFSSYGTSYEIHGFMAGISYRGGLSVEGARFMGFGSNEVPAQVEVFSNDTLRIRATSPGFSVIGRQIRSLQSAVIIYFGGDSIFHPDLVFTYDADKEQLRLNKSERFTSQGPYSNSYHRMDMNFDELLWDRGANTMNFQAMQGSSLSRATFESSSFFNYNYYIGLQGMDYVHPLAQLAAYSKMVQSNMFHVAPYADHTRYPEYQVRQQIMALSKLGFVYFDHERGIITIRQKLYDYIEASMENRDYDVIRFNSNVSGRSNNAELNLDSRDLTIHGIPVIFLSDSQNVQLVPRENTITLKKDRSFQFDGVVDAGLVRFSGENFYFNYDSFKIAMKNIDSMQFSVLTGQYNEYGEPVLTRIHNAIEIMTGALLIDEPNNKSGLEKHPQYPTFTSTAKSYIYFDNPEIQDGVYDRSNFYFELDPFTFDSLDNFRPEGISPSGFFRSAGILPAMEMEMTLRKDNSLGLVWQAPEEGVELYGGMGRFYQDLEMSSRGLRGSGSVDYLTSTHWSDDFLMHPDSLMGRTSQSLIRERLEEVEYPIVQNSVTDLTLYRSSEEMWLARVLEPFRIYSDSILHAGDLSLKPTGLSGTGALGMKEARFTSDNFRYGARTSQADSAGVQLRDAGAEDFSFLTSDVGIVLDHDARSAQFTSRGDQTLVEFPSNLYETSLDRMTWNMDSGRVELRLNKFIPGSAVDIGIDSLKTYGPVYSSMHEGQEGLHFTAPRATFDYRNNELMAHQVPFIEVADAYVFPDSGEVRIGNQASMHQLKNARVLADQYNRQHLIYDASIDIEGAHKYEGSGYYNYRDDNGSSFPIRFDRIWVDSTKVSRSQGTVLEEDMFMMSRNFGFKGEASMVATSPHLTFDGGVRLMHDCSIGRSWFRFTTEIDPADIRIPVGEQMMNTDLNKIVAGSLITRDSTHIYSAFLSARKDYFDANISQASGVLIFDQDRQAYVIATEGKLADPFLPGNYLRLETEACRIYAEGQINMTLDYGHVKLKAAGNAEHNLETDEFSAKLVLGMNFHFSPEALNIMGGEIDSLPTLDPVDLGSYHYQLAMRDLLGAEEAFRMERQMSLTGSYEGLPSSLKHTLFFNEVPLKWNQDTRSFRHNGKIGIGNIGDIQVNKKVDAYIELVERGSGDVFDIYLRVDDRTWYYLAYTPGGLQVLSSNRAFNELVYELKPSDRRVRAKLGEGQYIYSLAAQRRMELFIDRFLEAEEDFDDF